VISGELEAALAKAKVAELRERMFDTEGLMCVRRTLPDGRYYFIANRSLQPVEGWVPLATVSAVVRIMDPMTGESGLGRVRPLAEGSGCEVWLQLPPGASLILRTLKDGSPDEPPWTWWTQTAEGKDLQGEWKVEFLEGGPELPDAFTTPRLASWTELGGEEAERFAGTARYTLNFDLSPGRLKPGPQTWQLNLGSVAQSARVRLNGRDQGTVITPPFALTVGELKPLGNVLEVEVTNLAANRIRDLDRRGVNWKNFHDINFVNINYRPFDASDWPLTESGLLGPVTLTPVGPLNPGVNQ
jgi:hypothetical protein